MPRLLSLLLTLSLSLAAFADPPSEPAPAEQLKALLDEIAPDGRSARPPYDLAVHETELACGGPEGDLHAWLSEKVLRRGREQAARMKRLERLADGLRQPEQRARLALLRYAFGKAELEPTLGAARAAGAAALRRLGGLLEAEGRFDEAARLWLGLAAPALGPQAKGAEAAWRAVRRLVRLQKLRALLATRVEVMPLGVDIDTFLARLGKRHRARLQALAETVAANLSPQGSRRVLLRDPTVPAIGMARSTPEDGHERGVVLSSDSEDITLKTLGEGTARDAPVRVELFSRYNGSIAMALYRFDRGAWAAGSLARRLHGSTPLRRWTHALHPIEANNSEVTRASHQLEGLPEGFYVVTARARYAPALAYTTFVVSRTRLLLRAGASGVVGVAVDARSGAPRAGLPVMLRVRPSLDRGATISALRALADVDYSDASSAFDNEPPTGASDGAAVRYARAMGALAALRERTSLEETVVRGVTDQHGMVRLDGSWQAPHCHYDLRLIRADAGYAEASARLTPHGHHRVDRALVWTQQPLRRPGETIRLAGVLQRFDGGHWSAPEPGERRLELIGPGGVLLERRVTLDERGMFSAELPLPASAPLGRYRARIGGTAAWPAGVVRVSWFRRPPLAVELVLERRRLGAGVPQRGEVRVRLPGGGPASGAVVELQRPERGRCYQLLRTDEDGVARFALPALDAVERRQPVLVLAQVSGPDGQVVSARQQATLDPAPFRLRLEHEREGIAGEPVSVVVSAESWAGQPLAGATVVVGGQRKSLTTDAQGRVVARLVLRPGRQRVPFTAVAKGTVAIQQAELVIKGAPGTGPGEIAGDGILVRSASCARSGEPLEVTLQLARHADAPELTPVLLLAEQSGILHQQMLMLKPGRHQLRLATTHAWATGVHVRAIAFCAGREHEDRRYCKIAPSDKLVDLAIETDKPAYTPGAEVQARLIARDHRGRPLAGVRLTLGVVDEAIYQLRPDPTPQLSWFFYGHQMPNRVAAGRPVPAPRESGLIFLGPKLSVGWPLRRGGRRQLMRRGGGGAASGGRGFEPTLRADFNSSAHWVADLVTDAEGQVAVHFKLPDDMASWRFTARAIGDGLLVGELRSSRVASLPLEVDVSRPRGLRVGDRVQLPATARNRTDRELEVRFGHAGQPQASRTLRAGESASVTRELTPSAAGALEAEASAVAAGTPGDRARRRLTVLPRGDRLERRAQAALSAGATQLELMASGSRELEITLSAGLAGVVSDACEGLIGYPYGCVEQTMSRFMPAVVAARALKRARIPIAGTALEQKLPRAIGMGLDRLQRFQHADGGWGWWQHDRSNDVMTAYVLQGLSRCRLAGVHVPWQMTRRAGDYLARRLGRRQLSAGRVGSVAEMDVVAQVMLALAVHRRAGGSHLVERALRVCARRFASGEPLGPAKDYNRPSTRIDHLAWLLALNLVRDAAIDVPERYDALEVAIEREAPRRRRLMTHALELELLISLGRDKRADELAATLVGQRRAKGWGDTLLTATMIQSMSGLLERQQAEPSRLAVEVGGRRVAVIEASGAQLAHHRLDSAALAGAERVTLRPLSGAGAWSARQVGWIVGGRPQGDAVKVEARWSQRPAGAAPDAREQPLELEDGGLTLRRGAPLTLQLDCRLAADARLLRLTIPRPCGVELVHVNRKQRGVTHVSVGRDAIHVFIDHWPAGSHTLKLQLRPEIAGTLSAPGPLLAPMYGPELPRRLDGWPSQLRVR